MPVGLLSKLGSLVAEKPVALTVDTDKDVVLAPVSGRVVPLEELSDPVFAQGMLGVGVGIRPEDDVAYAPVSGTVTADVKTKHALLFKAENGAEVLLHVGLDSVALGGAGFRPLVHKGDSVLAGEAVLSFDRSLMAQRGIDDTVVVTVSNTDAFSDVTVSASGEVVAGKPLLRCVRQ